jgi:hypothetical protein
MLQEVELLVGGGGPEVLAAVGLRLAGSPWLRRWRWSHCSSCRRADW